MHLTAESEHGLALLHSASCGRPFVSTPPWPNALLQSLLQTLQQGREWASALPLEESAPRRRHVVQPTVLDFASIPSSVRSFLRSKRGAWTTYSFHTSLFDKPVSIFFVGAPNGSTKAARQQAARCMMQWLHVVHHQAREHNRCVRHLKIYVYWTPLQKKLPSSPASLNPNHANTAFTQTCANHAEIVVYRKEEWFKVFMHETFHTFQLDFSSLAMPHRDSLDRWFHLRTQGDVFEAYTEYWARVMHTLFCATQLLPTSEATSSALWRLSRTLLELETRFALCQAAKVLSFARLSYAALLTADRADYQEDTNAFAYYVVVAIMMAQGSLFPQWCVATHSPNTPLHFRQTRSHVEAFLKWLQRASQSPHVRQCMQCFQTQQPSLQHRAPWRHTLRMTVCTLDWNI